MLLANLLNELIRGNASDLHLVVGYRPRLRVNGNLRDATSESGVVEKNDVWSMLEPFLSEIQKVSLENRQDVNRTIVWNESEIGCRIRVCVFWDRRGLSAAFRLIPWKIPSLIDLDMPPIVERITRFKRGLVLVVGMVGSGKSTTLAAMVDEINSTRSERIFTIEDPIEYLHTSKKSLISQREVGTDVFSYEQGALSVMRADPDVVLISELRTPEAVKIALAMANTGHLVFSTMMAESVSEVVRRLIESFPESQETIRTLLANNIQAIITQRLVPKSAGGRAAINDIMIANPRIRTMIKDGSTDFATAIEAGADQGMCTMDDGLLNLYREGRITYETALSNIRERERLRDEPKASQAIQPV